MQIVNPPDNPRIATLVDMVRTLSMSDTPVAVLSAFALGYWPLYPIDYMVSLSHVDLPPGHFRITRQINVADVLSGRSPLAPPDPWGNRDKLPTGNSGFLAWVNQQRRPLLIHNLDVKNDPVLGDALAHVGSALCLPLFSGGELHYWNLQFRVGPEAFGPADLERSLLAANLIGGTNTRVMMMQEVKRLNTALQRQFEDVARVQQALLPRHLPDIPGLEIATSYLTSDQAGGDYYDFFPLEGGQWGVLIADVSGHGAAAATVMAMLHGILHAYNHPSKAPDAVLRYANQRLYEAGLEGNFVTAFFAVYNPADATFTFARAGHNPPLLKDGTNGTLRHLDDDGAPPLGLFEEYELSSSTIRLKPHDTVILYTDGITEAFSPTREMFGPERLDAALTGCSGAPDCVVDTVHAALFKHTHARTRADDQTLVALRYTGR